MVLTAHWLQPNVIFWIAVAVMATVPTLAWAWVSVQKSRHERDLKERMIERGMSADEIERVLGAGGEGKEDKRK